VELDIERERGDRATKKRKNEKRKKSQKKSCFIVQQKKTFHTSLCVSAWCQVSSVYTGIRGPLSLAVHQEYPPNPCSTPKCGEREAMSCSH